MSVWPTADQLALIESHLPPGRPVRIVIDGPSGSGKTTLGLALAQRLGIPLHSVESWVPGWDGLAEGTRITEELVTGQSPSYTSWDWATGSPGDPVEVDFDGDWIVEGCGTLTPKTVGQGVLAVWVEAEPKEAKRRGLERDGESFARNWERWHAQEVQHWRAHQPASLAAVKLET